MRIKNGDTSYIEKAIYQNLSVKKHSKRLDDLKIISAILLVIRFGLAWRQIPEFYGKWYSIYSRFRRWSKAGIIEKIFREFARNFPNGALPCLIPPFAKLKDVHQA